MKRRCVTLPALDWPRARTEVRAARVCGADWTVAVPGAGLYVTPAIHERDWVAPVLAPGEATRQLHHARPSLALPRAVLLGSNGNYYHHLLDYAVNARHLAAPRLAGLPLLVGAFAPERPFMAEILRFLGVPEARLVHLPRGTVARVGELTLLPPFQRRRGVVTDPRGAAWLRDRALAAGGAMGPERIYVSRALASARRVANEAEVIAALEPFGIRPVTLEGMAIADQARLFAGARLVVGPHGAGFANMAFAAHGAALVELTPMPGTNWGDAHANYFRNLAKGLGMRHLALPQRGTRLARDLTIDVPGLVAALRDLTGEG
jgi:capsular polysaccharide biosynthesis protein